MRNLLGRGSRLPSLVAVLAAALLSLPSPAGASTPVAHGHTCNAGAYVAVGVAVPSRAEAVPNTPTEPIAVRPIAPGITNAIAGLPQVSGGAGSVSGQQHKPIG